MQKSPKKSPSVRLVLREAELSFDEKFCNITTNHVERPGEIYKLGYHFQVLKELKTFFVKVGISLPNLNGEYVTIQNSVSDICKYFKNSNNNLLLKIFFSGNFGNKKFPSACPIKPDMYYIENFRVNDNLLKVRTGESKFLVTVEMCTKTSEMNCIATLKFYGQVTDDAKWKQEVDQMTKKKN